MHYLYRKTQDGEFLITQYLQDCTVGQFSPRPFRLWVAGEKRNGKTALSRLYFWLLSGGKFCVWYLRRQEEIVHTSYVVPKCRKFSFLQPGDYEIGPCVTREDCRGKGIYPYMLGCITAAEPDAVFYMIVRETNHASIRGVEKAGFRPCGTVVRSRVFKNYRKEREQ